MFINAQNFKQFNVKGVIERANDILTFLQSLNPTIERQHDLLKPLKKDAQESGDDWEYASLILAEGELMERIIRQQDKTVESAPVGWNSGFNHTEES